MIVNKSLFIKQSFSRLVRLIITGSGYVTSITILLIILFLFKNSYSLFDKPEVAPGFEIVIQERNPVRRLTPAQIRAIFDEDVTNWKAVGGPNLPITVFRYTRLSDQVDLTAEARTDSIGKLITSVPGIICFLPASQEIPEDGHILQLGDISLQDFFLGKEWYPTITPVAQYGLLPLLLGTLWISFGAIMMALPFSLAVAIYLSELAGKRLRSYLKPLIELLAGIPSVVYGFFGLVVIVPGLQRLFHLAVGETALAGSLVLAIMALPTIITVAEDAMQNTPSSMKEASLALGATHWQTIWRVIIPYARSGIASAVVLGIGRAIGETMAVLMVTGNAAVIPHTFLEPVRTIPATIAAELGEAPTGSAHYEALFALGGVLFLITLVISVVVDHISNGKD